MFPDYHFISVKHIAKKTSTFFSCLYAYFILALLSSLAFGWPPSEANKARWKSLVTQGDTEGLKAYITTLRERGEEDISQWINMTFDSKSKNSGKEPEVSHSPHIITSSGRRLWITTSGSLSVNMIQDNKGCSIYGAPYGQTSLHIAVQQGHLEMVAFLLEAGAAVDGNNLFTETPLTIAARTNNPELLELLLQHQASVEPSVLGPLYEAAGTGNLDLVNNLLTSGANPNGEEQTGRPLFHAARYGHLSVARRLIDAGAQINLQNYMQESPLHTATEHGQIEMVSYLLAAGANIEGINPEAETLNQQEVRARGVIRGHFYDDIEDDDKRYSCGSPLNRAAGNKHFDIVKLLIRKGADVGLVQPDCRAALQQVKPENGGIKANFHQYISLNSWDTFTPRFQKLIDSHSLSGYSFVSMNPLLNRAVIATRLNIPDTVTIKNPSKSAVTKIESFLTSEDFIAIHDRSARQKGNKLTIILSDDKGKRIAYPVVTHHNDWLSLMKESAILGARVDDIAFYPYAHHELQTHDYESEFQRHLPAHGTMKTIGKATKSEALKGYSSDASVPVDSVYIEPDSRRKELTSDNIDRDIFLFMQWHRPVLARLMSAALQDHPELYQKANDKGVDLFCLGCGSGQDVMACHKALKDQGIISRSKGIEQLQPLHWNAIVRGRQELETQYERMTCGFIKGDATKPADIIHANKMPDGLTIIIAEDFLVQQVLPGTYSSLKVLQELIQPGIADMVIIGGVHPSLVSERIAEMAGWKAQQVELYHSGETAGYWQRPKVGNNTPYSGPAFALTRESEDIERDRIFKRSWLRLASPVKAYDKSMMPSLLDLSMLGTTETWLEKIRILQWGQNVTSIDLSYSHLDNNKLNRIVNLLLGYPSLTHVTASGYESWYESLMSKLEATGRVKLMLRKDNQYKHELPTLNPDTAMRLGHYKTVPMDLLYTPLKDGAEFPTPKSSAWMSDIDSGYLSQNLISAYQTALSQLLLSLNIQLQETPADGLCFFHAASMQLNLGEGELRSILHNHVLLNQASIVEHFPQYAGEQFQTLLSELLHGSWGDAGHAQLVSWVFNRRVILIYFHSQTGKVKILTLNPGGQVNESDALSDIVDSDIILVHNGAGHWLAAGIAPENLNLSQHNGVFLVGATNPDTPEQQISEKLYSPNIFPQLIALLMTTWVSKFK